MTLVSVNPTTGQELERFAELTDPELEGRLDAAATRFLSWRATPLAERADLMRGAGAILRRGARKYAKVMALEMGKPIKEGQAEVEKCALVCDHYADHGAQFLRAEVVPTEAQQSQVRFEPLGPVLAVMPWNFPFWQVFRFAAPNLVAGNVGLLKHSANVSRCSLSIEEVFQEAGFPAGAFQSLLVGSSRVARIIADSRVRAVTLTGSEKAGIAVGAAAGRALKKAVLELGGSDAFVVLRDADVERAAKVAASARCINSGQSCIAAKRFIVEASVLDSFLEVFQEAMQALRVGDPLDESTQVGPQAREDLLGVLQSQVEDSIARGATLKGGGRRIDRKGFFFPPTVLSNVSPGMAAYDEEIFGPVASVLTASNDDDAIRLANDTRFGLGASLWTQDLDRASTLATRLDAGSVYVNGMVRSDPRLPFGGIKASGHGRELGREGIREFVNIKTVVIDP